MPEHVLPETSHHFLERHGESPTILDSFVHRHAVVVEVTKMSFVRGAGPLDNVARKWWFQMAALEQMRMKVGAMPGRLNERRNLMRREIRDQTAVSLDWNSLAALWSIRVEAEPHVGLRGVSAPQPVSHAGTGLMPATLGNGTERMLPGGVTQYFFPIITVPALPCGAPRGRTY